MRGGLALSEKPPSMSRRYGEEGFSAPRRLARRLPNSIVFRHRVRCRMLGRAGARLVGGLDLPCTVFYEMLQASFRVPSAFFRLRTFPQVAFAVSLRASSALSKTQHFVRNRARAGRADSSDRAPRSEGGDKARRRVFRTRSVDARPGKSTDARLRQPFAFLHTVGRDARRTERRSLACTTSTWEPPSRASAVRRR